MIKKIVEAFDPNENLVFLTLFCISKEEALTYLDNVVADELNKDEDGYAELTDNGWNPSERDNEESEEE